MAVLLFADFTATFAIHKKTRLLIVAYTRTFKNFCADLMRNLFVEMHNSKEQAKDVSLKSFCYSKYKNLLWKNISICKKSEEKVKKTMEVRTQKEENMKKVESMVSIVEVSSRRDTNASRWNTQRQCIHSGSLWWVFMLTTKHKYGWFA